MSATCAARSTSRSAGTPSRRSAGWATGWQPEVAEQDGVGGGARRDRVGGVRVRAALAATCVVAVILALSDVAFVLLQRRELESTLLGVARQEAAAVAAQVARNGTTAVDVTPAGAGEQVLVQVLDADGTVAAASPAIRRAPPLVGARPQPGTTVALREGRLPVGGEGPFAVAVREDRLPVGEEDPFAVVVQGVRGPEGPAVVVSAHSLETVRRANDVLIRLLALGYPVLLGLVAATSYWLTGRALAPVEAMR